MAKNNYGTNTVTVSDCGERESTFFIEPWIKERFDNKIIPDIRKRDKDCVIAIDGNEGCLFENTLIRTSEGDRKIKDLNNGKSFFVESLNIKNDKKSFDKAICIKTGRKELFEIELEDGRKVKATEKHTFFVLRRKKVYEIKLSELKVGDELICD